MKKILSVLLSVLLIFSVGVIAVGAQSEETTVRFKDGKLKIMMFNDTQDVGKNMDKRLTEFMEAALDAEKPDLAVFVGDQLSDVYPFATAEDFKICIDKTVAPLEARNIPFLATLGNHDHDREATLDEAGQFALYAAHDNFIAGQNATAEDPFSYNVPVLSSDGTRVAFNIYMIDTNNKGEGAVSYSGIFPEQLDWYNEVSARLQAANGGEVVPSFVFQHVPVKEIYSLMKTCSYTEKGAIYARRDKNWYVLDETKIAEGVLGEAPCSENFDTITGQYQAWVENGDVVGAFFAHDHVNNFFGVTDEGIRMGYNGGTGFRSYGRGGDRSVRIIEVDENDPANFTTRLLTYNEVTGKNLKLALSDLMTPAILTYVMKVVYGLFGWAINLINK